MTAWYSVFRGTWKPIPLALASLYIWEPVCNRNRVAGFLPSLSGSELCLQFREERYHRFEHLLLILRFCTKQKIIQRDTKAVRQFNGKLNWAGSPAVFNFHDVSTGHIHLLSELLLGESTAFAKALDSCGIGIPIKAHNRFLRFLKFGTRSKFQFGGSLHPIESLSQQNNLPTPPEGKGSAICFKSALRSSWRDTGTAGGGLSSFFIWPDCVSRYLFIRFPRTVLKAVWLDLIRQNNLMRQLLSTMSHFSLPTGTAGSQPYLKQLAFGKWGCLANHMIRFDVSQFCWLIYGVTLQCSSSFI